MVYLESIKIILLFLILHPSTSFQTLLLTIRTAPFLLGDFLPTVVVIMVIMAASLLPHVLTKLTLCSGGKGVPSDPCFRHHTS